MNIVKIIALSLLAAIIIPLTVISTDFGGKTYTAYDGPAPTAHYKLDESTVPPPGINPLANPGFESYPTSPGAPPSWTSSGGSLQLSRETIIVNSGVNALKITADGTASTPGAFQTLAAPGQIPIDTAFQFVVHGAQGGPGPFYPRIRSTVQDADGAPLYTVAQHSIGTTIEPDLNYNKVAVGFITHEAHNYRFLALLEGGTTAGVIGYYDDVAVEATVRIEDSIGIADGALGNPYHNSVVGAPGIIGSSYHFDGTSQVNVNGKLHNNIIVSGTTPLSFCAWGNADSFPTQADGVDSWRLVDKNTYIMGIESGQLRIQLTGMTPANHLFPIVVNHNEWHHYCGTFDGVQLCPFLDGELISDCVAVTGSFAASTNPLVIGNDQLTARFWHGRIDDVQIFVGSALSEVDIYNLYHKTIPLDTATVYGNVAIYIALIAIPIVMISVLITNRGNSK